MAQRLPVLKTPKCLVGGAFIRSEGGCVYPVHDRDGRFFANFPLCTRKDVRNAVEAAAKAGPGWSTRSSYNRGQILYRLAEMLEARAPELADALCVGTPSREAALAEVHAAIERTVHYAGWTDKFQPLLGGCNPVASPHFNFTLPEPVGIVGVLAPEECPLLALLSLVLPALTSGNTVVALASSSQPWPAILLGEMLAVSDLPAGVVNLLTGKRADLLPTFASHAHLRALCAVATGDEGLQLQTGAADALKRTCLLPANPPPDWFSERLQGLSWIREFVEFKTVWHPIGA